MRVWVTGAAGFIGASVTRQLVALEHDVTAIVLDGDPAPRLDGVRRRLRLAALDLADRARVGTLLAEGVPEAVVHLAWYADPRDYLTSRENLASLAMTVGLTEELLTAGCRRLIGVGTCLEYAASDRLRHEEDRCDPASLYASCKRSAYLIARALASQVGADLCWARVFHLHGPSEAPARFVPSVAETLRAGRRFAISPGGQVRDHLHVDDVAAGIVALIGPTARGVYNICSGEPVTLRAVAETVALLVGRPELLDVGGRPYRPDEVMFLAGDSSRLRALGWRPRFDLQSGLTDAIAAARYGGGSR